MKPAPSNRKPQAVRNGVAAATVAAPSAGVQAKFAQARQEIAAALIEREGEIDLALTGLIAGRHPLFVGDPGTAKSLLGRAVASFVGGKTFEILLSKFTEPGELFGPVSVAGLKADEYRRLVDGTMLDADVVFLDEIFKASSAILNSTLGVLNERQFRNGRTMLQVPLQLAIAASNEWPGGDNGGKELGALFDRFLLRKTVATIRSPEGLDRLLWDASLVPQLTVQVTPAEVLTARTQAGMLVWTPQAKQATVEIIETLRREGIAPGDRRIRQSVGVVQAYSYLCGGTKVTTDHLEVLAHTLWVDPAEQPAKTATVVGKIANPVGFKVNGYLAEADEVLRSAVPSADNRKEKLALAMTAATRLEEIVDAVQKLGTDPRVAKAAKYIDGQRQKLVSDLVASKCI